MSELKGRFVALRTTVGQEYNVAIMLESRLEAMRKSRKTIIKQAFPVKSIVVVEEVKGAIFLETEMPFILSSLTSGLRHAKGVVKGFLSYQDIEKYIMPRPIIETIGVNDIVEITGGPFIGMRGKVVYVDKSRGEVKVEISEAAYPLPITINADYIKIIQRAESDEIRST
ncbi:MAG: transcription elongation factor Spt5 [Thermofilum sp. ex4484_82]|nr:transcription elongation factor Spt5 [Thermoproteales archaeon]OYT30354.1 MAG: transcription elongation factor Spt5 [Thermofilum sp. ex4484_82]OYT39958.1 MAG: transcription elongation factor Spt5 [Archaeoglobales archaeon ex4484_92]RLE75213.1 MAG: transcription elongation factor Spt5 [Thermoprotei archaeon]RLE76402.1 MAG: transcription elongation factor Spt5 [Thermoprotei archaeon]